MLGRMSLLKKCCSLVFSTGLFLEGHRRVSGARSGEKLDLGSLPSQGPRTSVHTGASSSETHHRVTPRSAVRALCMYYSGVSTPPCQGRYFIRCVIEFGKSSFHIQLASFPAPLGLRPPRLPAPLGKPQRLSATRCLNR